MKKNKNNEPAFVVDATWCDTTDDFKFAFIMAKTGKTVITYDEMMFVINQTIKACLEANKIIEDAVNSTIKTIVEAMEAECKKKDPWYKRFWNKLKYAFTW